MSENNKYQIQSTARWKIPGDVPGNSRLYPVESEEDDYPTSNGGKTKKASSIANDFYKNQLVKSLSEKAHNISQRAKDFSRYKTRTVVQPVAILLLIMAGMLLSLTEFEDQITLKGNESFAANSVQAVSNDEERVTDLASVTPQKDTIDTKLDTNNQQTILINLTNKPVDESKIITHIVVKGDTLWDITEFYVNDPFRYPEVAKLSDIVTPDLIYPGDIVRIQT